MSDNKVGRRYLLTPCMEEKGWRMPFFPGMADDLLI